VSEQSLGLGIPDGHWLRIKVLHVVTAVDVFCDEPSIINNY
jgi:hypothetical protein